MPTTPHVRRATQALLAGALVAAGLVSAVTPASAAPSSRWSIDLPGAAVRESSPLGIDLDGGGLDVVFGAHDAKVYALHGSDGSTVGGWPRQTSHAVNSSPAGADTDGDSRPEVFVGSGVGSHGQCSGGAMYSFEHDGTERFRFQGSDQDCPSQAVHSSPAIGDINRDSNPDVTFGALGLRMYSLSHSGTMNGGWPYYTDDTVFSTPALADVNGDGQTDVIVGGDSSPGAPIDHRGGLVRAISGTGQTLWEFRVNEIVRSSPAVGDIDGDGKAEIVFGTGDYWVRQPGGASDATKVFALNLNGSLKWARDTGGYTMASPALADIDGNGRLDVAISTFDGPDPGRVFALRGSDGGDLPNFPKASGGGVVLGSISTADLNGDGGQDLLVPTGGGIFAYSGKTGALLFALEQGKVAFQNSPLVTDIDGNGLLDIVAAGTRPNGAGVAVRYEMAASDNAVLGATAWPTFHGDQRRTGAVTVPPLSQSQCAQAGPGGYWLVASDGGIFAFCDARFFGSTGALKLNQPIVGMESTPSGGGYWLVASDGGIFAFGDAVFRGSTGALRLNQPIVGMARTPSGNGYWLVAADGGIFAFGDAVFRGSTGAIKLNQPIRGMAATPTGNGYFLVAADGGIFAFGDAVFRGSTGAIKLNQPIRGMAATPSGNGYWLVASDGGIFAFGDAVFRGSTGAISLNQPIVGMDRNAAGSGYWLVASDGGIFAFGVPFFGSTGAVKLNQPVVGMAAAPKP
ncbi:MAG TPA: VCBS repeat-containing protein [Acidimicrobiales bacterium]|nr:VCBS repeat-containing protein [Acidimicrobiales bacterium]